MVTASKTNGAARALALSPYFDLQLRFALRLAELKNLAVAETVAHYTNLHRRFGYGKIALKGLDERWQAYIAGLCEQPDADARLAYTVDWYAGSSVEPAPVAVFGCFNFDPPDEDGVARIHFNPVDVADGVGPLHVSKLARRRAEVRKMARHIRATHPEARRLRGMSWLYNLDAYRRVFPPSYTDSTPIATGGIRYEGMSSWGQFLDHRGQVKDTMVSRCRARLPELDPDALWRVFPLPPRRAEAPLAAFLD